MAWKAERTEGVSEPESDSQIRTKVAHERSSLGQTRNNDQASFQTDAVSDSRETWQPVTPESGPQRSPEPQHRLPLPRADLPEFLQFAGHLDGPDFPCPESPGLPASLLQQRGAVRGLWRQSFRSDIGQTTEAFSL